MQHRYDIDKLSLGNYDSRSQNKSKFGYNNSYLLFFSLSIPSETIFLCQFYSILCNMYLFYFFLNSE